MYYNNTRGCNLEPMDVYCNPERKESLFCIYYRIIEIFKYYRNITNDMKRKLKLIEKRYCTKLKGEKGLCENPEYCNMPMDLVCHQCTFSKYKITKFGDSIYIVGCWERMNGKSNKF